MKKIRVAIVEDDESIAGSLVAIVNSDEALEMVGLFGNTDSFESALPQLVPDVVLLDIGLPGRTGMDFLPIGKRIAPQTQFLICTVFAEEEKIFECLKNGATGYITKGSPANKITEAIRDIYSGGSPMSASIARKIADALYRNNQPSEELDQLTAREREILGKLEQGFRYKEIADQVHLSVETVRTHIRNIYLKLQVQSRTEALNKIRGKRFFFF